MTEGTEQADDRTDDPSTGESADGHDGETPDATGEPAEGTPEEEADGQTDGLDGVDDELMAAAREEKRAAIPEEGYALVEIDRRKPPGEALTVVAEYSNLGAVSLPPTTDVNEYAVYDSEGRVYTERDL